MIKCENRSEFVEQFSTYETIGKYLLTNKFALTALEFHTELLEIGVELPCLRDYFSDSNRFQTIKTNLSTIVDAEIDDGISRISTIDHLDTTSLDIRTYDGSSTRIYEERIAILEWELKKARKMIDQNEIEVKISGFSTPMITSEQKIVNRMINQYLLMNNYRYTSITFAEENETFGLDEKDSIQDDALLSADLLHLYRWYSYQTELEQNKPNLVEFSSNVNFDATLIDEKKNLEISNDQLVSKEILRSFSLFSSTNSIRLFRKNVSMNLKKKKRNLIDKF